MTQIRPIVRSEGDTFLRLMCDVFDLDFSRARDVFFTEPLFDLDRKWALFESDRMVSILTTTPLIFGWGRAMGIAGVATDPEFQRQGYASRLIQRVLIEGGRRNEPAALLFARDPSVYLQNGFTPLDRVIRAPVISDFAGEDRMLEWDETTMLYDAWAAEEPARLRRDEKRWAYWRWNYRVTTAFENGYVCHEGHVLRETLYTARPTSLPVTEGTEWFGTTLMADQLHLPLGPATVDLHFMGINVPMVPQMFMTDQF